MKYIKEYIFNIFTYNVLHLLIFYLVYIKF